MGLYCLAGVAVVALAASGAYAQPCPCDGDVNLDTVVDENDLWCLYDQIFWSGECPNGDVNCDGVIDGCDWSAVDCLLAAGGPGCCDVPCGACCFYEMEMQQLTYAQVTETLCTAWLGGEYHGDGVACRPSPCDCQPNGFADGDDIAAGTSEDCNDNGIPDECESPPPADSGACCLEEWGGMFRQRGDALYRCRRGVLRGLHDLPEAEPFSRG